MTPEDQLKLHSLNELKIQYHIHDNGTPYLSYSTNNYDSMVKANKIIEESKLNSIELN